MRVRRLIVERELPQTVEDACLAAERVAAHAAAERDEVDTLALGTEITGRQKDLAVGQVEEVIALEAINPIEHRIVDAGSKQAAPAPSPDCAVRFQFAWPLPSPAVDDVEEESVLRR